MMLACDRFSYGHSGTCRFVGLRWWCFSSSQVGLESAEACIAPYPVRPVSRLGLARLRAVGRANRNRGAAPGTAGRCSSLRGDAGALYRAPRHETPGTECGPSPTRHWWHCAAGS
jgi:hypothetical protein